MAVEQNGFSQVIKHGVAYFFRDNKGKTKRGNKAKTPIIKDIIEDFQPDFLIVALGANYYKFSSSYARKDLNKLLKLMKSTDAPCLWIGPPDTRKFPKESKRVYKVLEETVAKQCEFFNSENVTKYPSSGGDGVHYWGKGKKTAREWALKVFKTFEKLNQ